MKFTKKRFLSLLACSTLILSIMCWDNLLTFVLRGYLKIYSLEKLGGPIHFESITHQAGKIIAEKALVIDSTNQPEGGYRLKADRMVVGYDFDWKKRELHFDFSFIEPRLLVVKRTEHLPFLADLFSKWHLLFNVTAGLSLQDCVIELSDFTGEQVETNRIAASIETRDIATEPVAVGIQFGPGDGFSNRGEFSFSRKGSDRLVKVEFYEVDCSALTRIGRFFGQGSQAWKVTGGSVRGSLELVIDKEGHFSLEGGVGLNQLACAHPALGFRGGVEEAQLKVSKRLDSIDVTGRLTILKPASFAFYLDGVPYWRASSLMGDLVFDSPGAGFLDLHGESVRGEESAPLVVKGSYRTSESAGTEAAAAVANVQIRVANLQQTTIEAQVSRAMDEARTTEAQISLKNIGAPEFKMNQAVVGVVNSDWEAVRVYGGRVNGTLRARMEGGKVKNLQIEQLAGEAMHLDVIPWGISFSMGAVSGSMALDPSSSDPFATLESDLSLSNGQVKFFGLHPDVWQFSDLQTELAIRGGVIQQSVVRAAFAGLKGAIEVDWTSPEEMFKFYFSGKTQDLSPLLPSRIHKGIDRAFPTDQVTIVAGLRREPVGYRVDGIVNVYNARSTDVDTLSFGCQLARVRNERNALASEQKEKIVRNVVGQLLPALALPAVEIHYDRKERNRGIAGFVVKNGWAKGKGLRLEKYLSPFIFQQLKLDLAGKGDFLASFDHQAAVIHYQGQDLVLESPDFVIRVDKLAASSEEGQLPAVHYLDFAKGLHFGFIPIASGSYLEKHSNLLFKDASAHVNIEGDKVHLLDVTTRCEDIVFTGRVEIDCRADEPDCSDVFVHTESVRGKASQLRKLCSHFGSHPLSELPFEGEISSESGDGFLKFLIRPGKTTTEARVHGYLSDGTLQFNGAAAALTDANLSFDFVCPAHTLSFNDLHGNLVIGAEEGLRDIYPLKADTFRFLDLAKNNIDFDVRLFSDGLECTRLVGGAIDDEDGTSQPPVRLILDCDRSHIDQLHPSAVGLTLQHWTSIKEFCFGITVPTHNLLKGMSLLGQAGLLPLPKADCERLKSVKSDGLVTLNFNYDDRSSLFNYTAKGESFAVGEKAFPEAILRGKWNGKVWAIDQLQLGEFSLAADLISEPDGWKVDFLGLRLGNTLLMGLEGKYNLASNALNAQVNLLELDLARLAVFPDCLDFVDFCHPQGQVRATGTLRTFYDKTKQDWQVSADLTGDLRRLQLNGLVFDDVSKSSIRFDLDKGLLLRNIKTGISLGSGPDDHIGLGLERFEYEFSRSKMTIDQLKFALPVQKVSTVVAALQANFPGSVNHFSADTLPQLKKEGLLEGTLSLESSPACRRLQFGLAEGNYHFAGREHYLKDFFLQSDPLSISFSTQYRCNEAQFWITGATPTPQDDNAIVAGQAYLEESNPITGINRNRLGIKWEYDPGNGSLGILEAKGVFAGADIDLVREGTIDDQQCLKGEVTVDVARISPFFPPAIGKRLEEWTLSGAYTAVGEWVYALDSLSSMRFLGTVKSDRFVFGEYQFSGLQLAMRASQDSFELSDFSLNDDAGMIVIPRISLDWQKDSKWLLTMPQATAANLCPSLLRRVDKQPVRLCRPFIARKLVVSQLSGILDEPSSFTGRGSLEFVNPAKENIPNTIFSIPADLLSRIGLDLSLLNPVAGTIVYDVGDGKIWLREFVDVFSQARISRFYLPPSNTSSYIDFSGNLSVKVRMKQYNLLFKLAEIFTVTIQGKVGRPTYSLHKQSEGASEEFEEANIIDHEDKRS